MSRLDLLREVLPFSGCTDEDLIRLGDIALDRTFSDGEVLFSLGDKAEHMMVVAEGKVELELPVSILGASRNIAFETMGRGEVVGWSALVPPHRFTLSARISGGAKILVFPRAELTALFDTVPELGFRVMRNIAAIVGRRFDHTQEMWAREIQRSLDERYR